MTFAGLALNLVRMGVKNPIETKDKLYFSFEQKHYEVEFHPALKEKVYLISLREYIPHHNARNETIFVKWFMCHKNPHYHPYGASFRDICNVVKARAINHSD